MSFNISDPEYSIMVHITLVHCTSLLGCLLFVSGAPSTKLFGEDPRYPGKPLPFPLKGRFDLLNPGKTSSGLDIIQGDIVVDPSRPVPNKFVPDPQYRWPEHPETGWPIVPYVITETSKDDTDVINEGLEHWMENTCLTFLETGFTDMPHIRFIKDSGCWSYIGRLYWKEGQDLSIGVGCESMDTVAHEVGHAIGFNHEQARSDRDDYVKVMWENIDDDKESNFDKRDTDNGGVEYDFTSTMQYASDGFSSNGKATMLPSMNPYLEPLMGIRQGLSFRDKLLANKVYGCIDKWESACELSSSTCLNDGYIGADCKCVCPTGTSGGDCGQVDGPYYPPLPCGGNVTEATDISSPNYPDGQAKHEWCMWWIQAKEGQKVRITFHDFDLSPRLSGKCYSYYDHLEIRAVGPLETGDVFCENEISPGQEFVSDGQELFIASTTHAIRFGGFSASIDFI